MVNKYVSINKQYRRLFQNPIDPTLTWDTYAELEAYLLSPTCYVNQIMGCLGIAYIVAEELGVKILKEIGFSNDNPDIPDNIIELLDGKSNIGHRHDVSDIDNLDTSGGTGSTTIAGYHIGPEPPTNTKLLWIDTTDSNIDTSFPSIIMDELRAIISNLVNQVNYLNQEVEYLKQGVIIIPDPVESYNLVSEDGYLFMTEDGYSLIEETAVITTLDDIFMTEDGYTLISEDGYTLISETIITTDNLLTEDGYTLISEDGYTFVNEITIITDNLLTEDGYTLISEDGYAFVNEVSSLTDNLLTEDDYILITEDGYLLVNEVSSIINNLLLTEDSNILITEDDYNINNEDDIAV